MTLLLSILWPALVAALLLGGLVGAFAGLPRDRRAAAAGLALAAALLTGVALFGPVAGRPAFWIEVIAFCLNAYLAGCVAGVALRRRPATSAT